MEIYFYQHCVIARFLFSMRMTSFSWKTFPTENSSVHILDLFWKGWKGKKLTDRHPDETIMPESTPSCSQEVCEACQPAFGQ